LATAAWSLLGCGGNMPEDYTVIESHHAPNGFTPPVALASAAPTASASSVPAAIPIAPIDLASWLDASESPAQRITVRAPQCIADLGCPFKPIDVPPCPPGQTFIDITAENLKANDGLTTVVRGTIWDEAMVRAYDCEPRCCRGKDPPRRLVLSRLFGLEGTVDRSRRLKLFDARFPATFACQADESAVCCDLPLEINVLVYGTIQLDRSSDRVPANRIENPHLCRVSP
jgi:hypothetical protein